MAQNHRHRSRHPHRRPLEDHAPARRRQGASRTRASTSPSSAASRSSARAARSTEMPALMARTCGICPVSHLLAAARPATTSWQVRIPETGGGQAAPDDELRPDHPVARAELLPPLLARPAARLDAARPSQHLRRDAAAIRRWPRTASGCASSASRSSSGWAASASTRPGSCPAAWPSRWTAKRDAHPGPDPEAYAIIQAHAGAGTRPTAQFADEIGPLRQLPHPVHGPGLARRPPGALRRRALRIVDARAARSSTTRSRPRATTSTTSAKRSSPSAT
jgi:hypothetical protein